MGIRVNQNLFSLLVNRNLSRVSSRLMTTFERLSSGQRINRSEDDPAGLAISNSLRHDIRGFQQGIRNANNALSVSSTAESSLGQVVDLLQRLRELSIQAASDTSNAEGRRITQIEVDEIVEEIDRISSATEFAGRFLLNGSSDGARAQIGNSGMQFITVALYDARAAALGLRARDTGIDTVGTSSIAGGGDLTINGVNIPLSVDDGKSSILSSASAIAKANAINQVTDQTGVTAKVEQAQYSKPAASIADVSLDGISSALVINGVNIGAVAVSAGDSSGTLVQAINGVSDQTGVTASVGDNGQLTLTAPDGRNIQIVTQGSVGDELGLMASNGDLSNYIATGRITLWSTEPITVGDTSNLIGFDSQPSVSIDPNTALSFVDVSSREDANDALGTVDEALKAIMRWRTELGATQNRLESAVEKLQRDVEEISATDSRIRDTDFAQEAARLAQLQILQDAGLAILAQANLMPRNALSLLQMR